MDIQEVSSTKRHMKTNIKYLNREEAKKFSHFISLIGQYSHYIMSIEYLSYTVNKMCTLQQPWQSAPLPQLLSKSG